MALSNAKTVGQYLRELPPEKRQVIGAVRKVVVQNLPKGYKESMNFGMINYTIPLKAYPETYNGQPLCYAGLSAQKNYYTLYLMSAYGDARQTAWIATEFKKRGKKLDMGKSCVRFKKLDDIPLDVIGEAIASTPPDAYIKRYEAARKGR